MTLLAILLVLAGLLAWWGARRSGSAEAYFTADRRAGAWLVGVAGTAVAVSAFTFVGGPGLFAVVGAGSLWIVLSAPLTGALQCWAVGEPIVELSRRHAALTPQELLGARFGAAAGGMGALVVAVGCVASLTVQVRAAEVLGAAFLGVPGWVAATLAMAAVAAYTAAGGMRSGLLADAVQGAVMAALALLLAGAALASAGGFDGALATLRESRPALLGSFGQAPPERALAWFLLFCLGTCAQPHYLQKFFFLRSREELRLLPAVLTGALATTLAVWLGVGLAGAALATDGRLVLVRTDELTPRVMALLGPGAMLLAAAAVLAALMSTAASFLNLAAAAITRDLPRAAGRTAGSVRAARFATAAVAAAALGAGLASERTVALLGVAGWGFFTAALLPVSTLGLAWKGARGSAAAWAIGAGALTDLALESARAALPPGLEPGLAGAAVGTLVLVATGLLRDRQER